MEKTLEDLKIELELLLGELREVQESIEKLKLLPITKINEGIGELKCDIDFVEGKLENIFESYFEEDDDCLDFLQNLNLDEYTKSYAKYQWEKSEEEDRKRGLK